MNLYWVISFAKFTYYPLFDRLKNFCSVINAPFLLFSQYLVPTALLQLCFSFYNFLIWYHPVWCLFSNYSNSNHFSILESTDFHSKQLLCTLHQYYYYNCFSYLNFRILSYFSLNELQNSCLVFSSKPPVGNSCQD